MGEGGPGSQHFPPTKALPQLLHQSRESWHGGNGGEANSCNVRRRGRPCRQSHHIAEVFFSWVSQQFATSVYIHATFGDGWPGESLSAWLLTCLIGETPVRECPGRRQWRQLHTVKTGWWRRSSSSWGRANNGAIPAFEGNGFLIMWFSQSYLFICVCILPCILS